MSRDRIDSRPSRDAQAERFKDKLKHRLVGYGPRKVDHTVLVLHSLERISLLAQDVYSFAAGLPGLEAIEGKMTKEQFGHVFKVLFYQQWAVNMERFKVQYKEGAATVTVRKPRTLLPISEQSFNLPDPLHEVVAQFGPVDLPEIGVTAYPVFLRSEAPTQDDIRIATTWLPKFKQVVSYMGAVFELSDSLPAPGHSGGFSTILLPVPTKDASNDEVWSSADELHPEAVNEGEEGKVQGNPMPPVHPSAPHVDGLTVGSDPSQEGQIPLIPASIGGGWNPRALVNVLGPTNGGKDIDGYLAAVMNSAISRPRGVIYAIEYGGSRSPEMERESFLEAASHYDVRHFIGRRI